MNSESGPTQLLTEQKHALRAHLKTTRASLSEIQRTEYSEEILKKLLNLDQLKNARQIFTYISYMSEVQTHDLLKELLLRRITLSVPKITDATTMLSQQITDWQSLEPDVLGILAPTSGDITDGPFDVAITPGLGFTEQGHRIGFGAGYYDRWFSSHQVKYKIALAFEIQLNDQIPIEETDIPVDLIITENRIIHIQ